MQKTSLDHWERYYRGGALATCPTSSDMSYDKELRDCWEAFFSDVPNGARILDVGTGNGAVALIASELGARLQRSWEIHATDLALIDPVRHVPGGAERLRSIQFHPGVGTEKLPFESGSIAAVSGHYALEYMDIPAALAEIRRVLAAGMGRAQFVLHHLESQLVQNAMRSLDEADTVKDSRVYRQLRRLLLVDADKTVLLQRRQVELQQSIRDLKQAFAQLPSAAHSSFIAVTLDAVRKLLDLRRSHSSHFVEQQISVVETDFRAARKRLNDLIGHALDQAGIDTLQEQCRAAGFAEVSAEPIYHNQQNLVGWLLRLS